MIQVPAAVSPDRALRATALVGLLFCAAALRPPPDPVADRVVQLVGVPSPGWYEADDLAAAARAAGAPPAWKASSPVQDGDTVRLVDGWALPERPSGATTTRVFGARLSLNAASLADLDTLPGIGPALAKRIVEGRPYRRTRDLARVKGIGPKKLAKLAGLVEP